MPEATGNRLKQRLAWKKLARSPFGPESSVDRPDLVEPELEGHLSLLDHVLPRLELVQPGHHEKQFEGGVLQYQELLEPDNAGMEYTRERWSLCDKFGRVYKHWQPGHFQWQWIDIDHRGRVVFGDEGKLWAWEGFPDGEPKMIADLNENKFEPVIAPDWALNW